ncbi:hypothetical protein C0992_000471 [Termitomyces sp. T32_za158]|nr:hypothetical protein C0992_000471 [Termitomyces sp. T32_za158]
MPIDLAIEKYVLFSQEVFSNVKKWSWAEKFSATVFESGMRAMIQSAGFPQDVLMKEDHPLCRSFVVALPSANMTPQIFRTYEVSANQGYDCTVIQAARATTATPDVFKPVSISSIAVSEFFVGASLRYSNPTNLALEEAEITLGLSQPVACLVNIGAGNPGHISWKLNNVVGSQLVKLLHQIATDCEDLAEYIAKSYLQTPGLFYRLSVNQGLQKMAVDDWNKQGEIQTHTLAYLKEAKTTDQLNILADTLCRGGTMSTNLLNKESPSKLAKALLPIVPAPSLLFIGREDILSDLEKCFDPQKSSLKMQVQ